MIGYLGPKNSFTYLASKTFYVAKELKPYNNIYRLFDALKEDEVEGIVLPIENSIEGSVSLVLDKLIEEDVHINKEIVIKINLSLISKSNSTNTIKKVISHPHALAQVRKTLKEELGSYKEITSLSTSDAIKELKNLDESHAAVASKMAVYDDLNIVLDDISDEKNNETRFIYLTKSLDVQGFHNKSSIICSANKNTSGALYDILHEFAVRNIDLTRIESRPAKHLLGEYVFHIDFAGNIEEDHIKECLDMVRHKTTYLKIIGSYFSKKIG